MSNQLELTKPDQPQSEAVSTRTGSTNFDQSASSVLHSIIERAPNITPDGYATIKGMMELYKDLAAIENERHFARAFNSLQSEISQIKATKAVPNKDGTLRYKYAPLEEIDAQLRPLALKYGFNYWFDEGESNEGKITKVCTVQHVGGHKRSNSFTVRRSAPPAASDTQADGSTHSYAKRGALCDAFGIVIEHSDDDARMTGKPIGKALAEDLEKRLKDCGADEEAFLKMAGVTKYADISDNQFEWLDKMVARKEIKAGIRDEDGNYK